MATVATGAKQKIEAKREETRQQRVEKIVELCAGGRKLNDRYRSK